MRKLLFTFCIFISFSAMAQVDSTTSNLMNELDTKTAKPQGKPPVKVFLAQRLINANTVEMLQKGHFEFKVVPNPYEQSAVIQVPAYGKSILKIFSSDGKLIMQTETVENLPMPQGLPAGVYQVVLINDNKVLHRMVVKE